MKPIYFSVAALIVLFIAVIVLAIGGCTMYWTDDLFYASVLTFKQADAVVYDSNELHLEAWDLSSDPEKLRMLYGPLFLETGE